MSKKLRKCLSLVLAVMLLASISAFGTLDASADYKTGDGLAAYAMTAYNEGWRYVWGGASYGAVDCSGLIYSYVGGGARVTEDMLYSSPESGYVANGVPDIPGIALWQPGHVGVYIGNGMAVDARDEISNVCYSAVSSKSWVMWFKVAGITYGDDTGVANNNQNAEKTDSAANTDTSDKNVVFDVLSLGSQNKEVNALQERLRELGYFDDSTTDYFGTVTQAALIDFQITAGLTADGIYTEDVKTALFADNAPEKPISSNVNPEESTGSENAENETETDTEIEIETDMTDSETVSVTDADDSEIVSDAMQTECDTESKSDIETESDIEINDVNAAEDLIYSIGDVDEEITNIQYILILKGYYDYDLTYTYDDNTAYAVAQYQIDNDLDVTGNVDRATFNSLFGIFGSGEPDSDTAADASDDVLTVGDEGENVEKLQESLTEWGFIGEDDYEEGVYDESTRDAVEFAQGMLGFAPDGSATQELVSSLKPENDYEEEPEPEKTSYVKLSQTADTQPETDSDEQTAESETDVSEPTSTVSTPEVVTIYLNAASDTDTLNTENVSSGADSASDTKTESKAADTSSEVKTSSVSSSGADVAPVDVPKTGVITLYPGMAAAIGVIASLMIIFFAANVHYWNVSMEKRKQRAKRAVSVSAYRRSSR